LEIKWTKLPPYFCCQAAWLNRSNAWLPFKVQSRRLAAKRQGKMSSLFSGTSLGEKWHFFVIDRQFIKD